MGIFRGVAVCLLVASGVAWGETSRHGTAILWINDAQEIVIAADSKVIPSTSVVRGDGTVVPIARAATYDACKLRAMGRTVVGVAGTVGVSGITSVLDLDMKEIARAQSREELVAGIAAWLKRVEKPYEQAIEDDPKGFAESNQRNRNGVFLQATFVLFDWKGELLHYTSEASYAPGVGIRVHTNAVEGEGFGGVGEMKPLQTGSDGRVKTEINTLLLSAKTTEERTAALKKTIGSIAAGSEAVGGHVDVVQVTKDGIVPVDVKAGCARYFVGR
ncbi:MAG: hypothetical protein PW789_04750 [Edaphobacter sp.]|uniref:hypothetical protein n=1 Tax=Edaphobacter sp. TaxID=1934404 RepID=UPI00238550D9|nr:hypothetical protein [Edaphobacter sp.]MDE1175896.1 hypothetical protein [Edaphobacter sp.]